jgi:hypothetical protein
MTGYTQKRRTRGGPDPKLAKRQVELFNRNHPVGSRVWYWQSLPHGPVLETKVRYPASLLPSGMPVAMVEGVSGYVGIDWICPVDEDRREAVNPTVLER